MYSQTKSYSDVSDKRCKYSPGQKTLCNLTSKYLKTAIKLHD